MKNKIGLESHGEGNDGKNINKHISGKPNLEFYNRWKAWGLFGSSLK